MYLFVLTVLCPVDMINLPYVFLTYCSIYADVYISVGSVKIKNLVICFHFFLPF